MIPDTFTRVRELLEPLADPARGADMSAYMRGRFPFLGIPAPARRAATRELLRDLGELDRGFIRAAFGAEEREYQYVACDHIRRVGISDLELAHRLVRTRSWWDTVDALARPIGANRDEPVMRRWAVDGDLWVRRVAIIAQLGMGTATDAPLLGWTIEQNLGSGEFFIDKAIGWALRDYARHDPAWVRSFLDATELSALSAREARRHLA